jgi:VWFA-related protein
MKIKAMLYPALLGVLLCAPAASLAQFTPGQSFSVRIATPGIDDALIAASSPDSSLFADGSLAMNEERWSDAASIFAKVASQQGAHADAAYYWKAYAENKQEQSKSALATCSELRHNYPKSRWIEECGALQIEIRAKSGHPLQPKAEKDENLKLLALNALMRQEEPRALKQIREILQGDFSERFKVGVIYILALNPSKQARELLTQIVQMKIDAGHPTPVLQNYATAGLEGRLPGISHPAADGGNLLVTLDVVVTDPSGQPVSGLQAEEFKLLDNSQPQSLVSFEAASRASAKADSPTEVILVLDAINSSPLAEGSDRLWLDKYLNQNGGQLALPTSIVLLTDLRVKAQHPPTRDAKVLKSFLAANPTGWRSIQRGTGYWGAVDRRKLSLDSLNLLASSLAKRPGRKLVIWISPGWSAMSGQAPTMSAKEKQNLFNYIASVSTDLRKARIKLYSVNPDLRGVETLYYKTFLKGVAEPKDVDLGDLMLQVIAYQTGGKVLVDDNDLSRLIERCVADAEANYVLAFNPPPAAHPNEYHEIKVVLDKPGLTARTRTGYYTQP